MTILALICIPPVPLPAKLIVGTGVTEQGGAVYVFELQISSQLQYHKLSIHPYIHPSTYDSRCRNWGSVCKELTTYPPYIMFCPPHCCR